MESKYSNLRPPESDSDDDYEGFSFGDQEDSETKRKQRALFVVDVDDEIYHAVINGDLEKLKKELNCMSNFRIDEPIKNGLTLLHLACRYSHINIVKYLLNEKQANVNRQIDSITPLMELCCSDIKLQHNSIVILKLLLERNVICNVSDKFGMTPFMYACKNGLYDICEYLISNYNISLDCCDNQWYTPLFYAVENHHTNIVKLLLDTNQFDLDHVNRNGYTVKQIAQFNDYKDILDIFPPEEYKYLIPTQYFSYNTIKDQIPRIFYKDRPIQNELSLQKNDHNHNDDDDNIDNQQFIPQPEYFPDIHEILLKMKMEIFLDKFALKYVNLGDFLTMNDEKLKEIGIEYPIHRNKILLGILQFHLDHWSKKSIAFVKGKQKETFYDILLIVGNHLKNAIIINSSIIYVQQNLKNQHFGKITTENVKLLKNEINFYKKEIKELQKTCKYLHSFTPNKPPLLIDDTIRTKHKKKRRTHGKIKKYFQYSIIISLSIAICLKIKKFI